MTSIKLVYYKDGIRLLFGHYDLELEVLLVLKM